MVGSIQAPTQVLHKSTRAFEHNRWYSSLGTVIVAALLDSNDYELVFDPEPIYDAYLGEEWFLTTP